MRRVTNDEREIRAWAAQHDAHPVERAPFRPDGEPAQLGFVFGDAPEAAEQLRPIDWSRFFAVFHLIGLVLSYDGDSDYELMKIEGSKNKGANEKRMQA